MAKAEIFGDLLIAMLKNNTCEFHDISRPKESPLFEVKSKHHYIDIGFAAGNWSLLRRDPRDENCVLRSFESDVALKSFELRYETDDFCFFHPDDSSRLIHRRDMKEFK